MENTTKEFRTLTINRKMTWAEYSNSHYPLMEASNFGYQHNIGHTLSRWDKYSPEVYVCKANPKHNYGLDFKVYLRYDTPDGHTFFKAISFGGSSITSNPFRQVLSIAFIERDMGEDAIKLTEESTGLKRDEIKIVTNMGWPNTPEQRKSLRGSWMTLTTSA